MQLLRRTPVSVVNAIFVAVIAGAAAVVAGPSVRARARRPAGASPRRGRRRRLHWPARFLDSVIDNISDLVFVKDGAGRFVLVNRAVEELLGTPGEELLGRRDRDLFPPEQADSFERGDDAARSSERWLDLGEEVVRTRGKGPRVIHTKKIAIRFDEGSPAYVLGIAEDVTEMKRSWEERERLLSSEHAARAEAEAARAAAESTIRRLHGVLDIAGTALSHLALPDLLRDVTHGVRSLFAVDVVSVVLLTPDRRELEVRAALGAEEAVAQGLRFPADRGLAGRTLAARRPIVVDDVSQVELASPILRDRGVRSVLAVPLRTNGHAIGVLHVGTLAPRHFTEAEAALLQVVADRVAVAIDRARLYEEERRAREEAQQAVRAREELLAVVSHDLRNALNTVLLGARTAQLRLEQGGDAPARIELVTRSAEQMRRLIQDLLDSSKIDAEGLSVECRRSDPAAIVAEAERVARPMADHKGIRLEARAPASMPAVLCDRERILQVLSNLLGNAVKFTPPGGTVRLTAAQEGPFIVFAVADNGPGIPEEMLPRIFERRWRADRTSRESSGLGLYIAKGIVEAHGGRLWAESREGAGSLFRFTLATAPG